MGTDAGRCTNTLRLNEYQYFQPDNVAECGGAVIKVERQPRKSRNMNASTFGKRHVVPFSCFNFLNLLESRTNDRLNTRGSKCSPRLSVRHCKRPPSLLHPMSSPSSSNSVANKSVCHVNVYFQNSMTDTIYSRLQRPSLRQTSFASSSLRY